MQKSVCEQETPRLSKQNMHGRFKLQVAGECR